jgi:hypothetical protein
MATLYFHMQKPTSFFKYTSLNTAKAILANNSFRYSSPLLFNDPFDIQTECIADKHPRFYSQDLVQRLNELVENFEPTETLKEPWKSFVTTLQELTRKFGYRKEKINEGLIREIEKRTSYEDINRAMGLMNVWLMEHLKTLRVFCITERPDNLLMWSHYGVNHTGVVFEISGVSETDNNGFELRKISYEKNPFVMFKMSDVVRARLYGEDTMRSKLDYSKDIFRKSDTWEYEEEWRVVEKIKDFEGAPYLDKPIIGDQIQSIIFGCACTKNSVEEIRELGIEHKHIRFYQAEKSRTHYTLSFNEI